MAEQPARLQDGGVRWPLDREAPGDGRERADRIRGLQRGRKLAGQVAAHVRETDPQVAQFAERNPQGVAAAPGRNRTPANTVPGASSVGAGPVSGPATNAPLPCSQMRSLQPSGRTRPVRGGPLPGTT